MRGLGTVIFVGFVAIILFGIVAPSVLEPLTEVFLQDTAVQNSQIDEQGFVDGTLNSILVWGPLFVLGSAVASAAVWYLRRERRTATRLR